MTHDDFERRALLSTVINMRGPSETLDDVSCHLILLQIVLLSTMFTRLASSLRDR